MFHRILTALAFAAVLTLAACEDSDEKAEGFYQSGLSLLAEGDLDRAAVEFRNVFRYNGEHEDARRQLALILEAQDRASAAYGQYLRLAEQYPQLVDVRQALARIAIRQQSWEEAERHGRVAIELDPDAAISQSIRVSLDYRKAIVEDAAADREALAREALQLVEADPLDLMSRNVLIAHELTFGRPSAALEHIDAAIAQVPDDLTYYIIKLQAFEALQDNSAIEQLLKQMYTLFPESAEVQQALITFYVQRENFDDAEAFLRELAGEDTADPAGFVTVIQLINRARGGDAALAEVERLIAANADLPENRDFYRAIRASYIFDNGQADAAIAELQEIITDAPDSDQIRQIKGTLATMLLRTGNQVGGRALIEEVLETDTSNVTALKLRAELLIDGDQPAEAVIDLRRALDQSPRDTSILLLLARAHERNGNSELQGERLATAVDVSNAGARESLLYAEFLLRANRVDAARTVMDDARNANPTNLDVLALLARLALADNAIGVVRGIIADVERLQDQPGAPELLQSLRTGLLLQQNRIDEGLALLQEQAGAEGKDTGAVYAILQTQLRTGKLDEARAYLDRLLEVNPDDPLLQMMNAALFVAEGSPEQSETILREVIAQNPTFDGAAGQLYIQLRREGRTDEARTILENALAQNADAPRLLLLQAGELEQSGDVEGAIDIYETLYSRDTNNVTMANNLASLLSTFRDDPESLARSVAVARRLRGTEIPAFQDTYGWIAYQQGNVEEALEYLEPAAQGLPDNPLVQYHLAMVYVALERTEEAAARLTRAIELAGPDSILPQMQQARDVLRTLQSN